MRTRHVILIFSLLVLPLMCQEGRAQNSYPTFYESPKESYVKSMKSVFEDIRFGKWEKALKDYNKIVDKSASAQAKNPGYTNTQMDALSPLPQLSMAILLSTENTGLTSLPVDYRKAYYLLKPALTFKDKDALNNFLTDPDVNVHLSMIEDRIVNKLCAMASSENTEQAYDSVVDSLLPSSLRYQDMKMKREELAFYAVKKAPTEAECERYLAKYTEALASHRNTISRELDSIRYYAIDFSITGLKKYISEYPNSSYHRKALDSLETLEFRNVNNTAASCRSFLQEYPTSKYTMTVKKKFTELAYREAIDTGTAAAYQNFCKEFPYDVRYENVFDSLLYRNVQDIYDTVFANKEPDHEKYLSSTFLDSVNNREAAIKKMIADSMTPPAQKNIWTGTKAGEIIAYNHMDIKDIDIKNKKAASVHVLLTGDTNVQNLGVENDIYIDFIIDGNALKVDDIRMNGGKSSMKSGM